MVNRLFVCYWQILLEYASCAWDSYMTKQLEKIIGGQHSAARLWVKQCHKYMPGTVCVTKLRLPLKAKKDGSNTVNDAYSSK